MYPAAECGVLYSGFEKCRDFRGTAHRQIDQFDFTYLSNIIDAHVPVRIGIKDSDLVDKSLRLLKVHQLKMAEFHMDANIHSLMKKLGYTTKKEDIPSSIDLLKCVLDSTVFNLGIKESSSGNHSESFSETLDWVTGTFILYQMYFAVTANEYMNQKIQEHMQTLRTVIEANNGAWKFDIYKFD